MVFAEYFGETCLLPEIDEDDAGAAVTLSLLIIVRKNKSFFSYLTCSCLDLDLEAWLISLDKGFSLRILLRRLLLGVVDADNG